jgi:hypothetical protein
VLEKEKKGGKERVVVMGDSVFIVARQRWGTGPVEVRHGGKGIGGSGDREVARGR